VGFNCYHRHRWRAMAAALLSRLFLFLLVALPPLAVGQASSSCKQAVLSEQIVTIDGMAFCAPGHRKVTQQTADGKATTVKCEMCSRGTYTGYTPRTGLSKTTVNIAGFPAASSSVDVSLLNDASECELCLPGTTSDQVGLYCPNVGGGKQEGYGCTPVSSDKYEHAPFGGMSRPTTCQSDTFPLRWVQEVKLSQAAQQPQQEQQALSVADFIGVAQTSFFADPCIYCPDGFVFDKSLRDDASKTALPCRACEAGKYRFTYNSCAPCKTCTYRGGSSLNTVTKLHFSNGTEQPSSLLKLNEPWPARCVACPQGRYSAEGSTYCHACPAGQSTLAESCSGDATTSCAFACPPGQFVVKTPADAAGGGAQAEEELSCAVCPAGTASYGNNANTFCAKCKGNRYTPWTGFTECKLCPEGKTANADHTECVGCPPGTFMPSGALQNNCTTCLAGKYSALTDSTACTKCAPGSYQGLDGMSKCERASPGWYVPGPQAERERPCKPGTYQPNKNTYATTCIKCAPGRFQPEARQTECMVAQANTFTRDVNGTEEYPYMSLDGTHGAVSNTVCPAGTWTGPDNTATKFEVNEVTYSVPFQPRSEVHGLDRQADEWSKGAPDEDRPELGFPHRAYAAFSSRRRGCNLCPIHYYNDAAGFSCRECPSPSIKFFFIPFTDHHYSDLRRRTCHSCWGTLKIGYEPVAIDTGLNWPVHYLGSQTPNIHAQCKFNWHLILVIVLVILLILLLCCCCCLFPEIVEAGVAAAEASEEVAEASEEAAEGAVKFFKKAWKGVKYIFKAFWYVLKSVFFLPFLVFLSLSLMAANLLRIATEKLAKFLDEKITSEKSARAPRLPSVISNIMIASARARAVLQNVTGQGGLRHRGAWHAIKKRGKTVYRRVAASTALTADGVNVVANPETSNDAENASEAAEKPPLDYDSYLLRAAISLPHLIVQLLFVAAVFSILVPLWSENNNEVRGEPVRWQRMRSTYDDNAKLFYWLPLIVWAILCELAAVFYFAKYKSRFLMMSCTTVATAWWFVFVGLAAA